MGAGELSRPKPGQARISRTVNRKWGGEVGAANCHVGEPLLGEIERAANRHRISVSQLVSAIVMSSYIRSCGLETIDAFDPLTPTEHILRLVEAVKGTYATPGHEKRDKPFSGTMGLPEYPIRIVEQDPNI